MSTNFPHGKDAVVWTWEISWKAICDSGLHQTEGTFAKELSKKLLFNIILSSTAYVPMNLCLKQFPTTWTLTSIAGTLMMHWNSSIACWACHCSHWDIFLSSDSLSHSACIYTLHLIRLSLCDILKGTRNNWLNLNNTFRPNTCMAHMKKIQHRITCMCNKKRDSHVTVMWYSFDISRVLETKAQFSAMCIHSVATLHG